MIAVADNTDGAVAVFVEAADFSGRHSHESPTTIAGSEDSGLSSGTSYFTAVAGDELDVVDLCGKWHLAEWHCIAELSFPMPSYATVTACEFEACLWGVSFLQSMLHSVESARDNIEHWQVLDTRKFVVLQLAELLP